MYNCQSGYDKDLIVVMIYGLLMLMNRSPHKKITGLRKRFQDGLQCVCQFNILWTTPFGTTPESGFPHFSVPFESQASVKDGCAPVPSESGL